MIQKFVEALKDGSLAVPLRCREVRRHGNQL